MENITEALEMWQEQCDNWFMCKDLLYHIYQKDCSVKDDYIDCTNTH